MYIMRHYGGGALIGQLRGPFKRGAIKWVMYIVDYYGGGALIGHLTDHLKRVILIVGQYRAHDLKVVSSSSNMTQWIWCSHPLSPPPCGVRRPSNTVHPAANGDLESFWGATWLVIFQSGKTSGAHTIVCKRWSVFLQVTSPALRVC